MNLTELETFRSAEHSAHRLIESQALLELEEDGRLEALPGDKPAPSTAPGVA